MKPALIINARNKANFVAKAVRGALSQTVPCEILLSDQFSTDGTLKIMQDEVENYLAQRDEYEGFPAFHTIKVLQCPIDGPYNMATGNAHFDWLWRQTSAKIVFQTSADDYDLPNRVKVCMEAIEQHPCDIIGTTQYFERPGRAENPVSGAPRESGYLNAGEALLTLAYGSCIAGYKRSFLEKMEGGGPNTIDVLYGYLAALTGGYYVVCDPQHVHCDVPDAQNMGFQGKLAGTTGDEHMRMAELNHAQLFRLYRACADRALKLLNGSVPTEHWVPLMNSMLGQACAWIDAREVLSARGIVPATL
jgi:hypothetical protein